MKTSLVCIDVYTISEGDTLYSIAEKYDLSVIYTGYYYEKPNLNVKELKELNDSFPTAEDAFNHLDEMRSFSSS